MADLTNTASVAYRDSVGAAHSGFSNTVIVAVATVGVPVVLPTPDLSTLADAIPVDSTINLSYPSGFAGVSFQWSFIPTTAGTGAPPSGNGSPASPAGTVSFRTPGANASLANFHLSAGAYELDVTAQDTAGHVSATAKKDIHLTSSDLAGIQVYPDPWRSDAHAGKPILFEGVPLGGVVKIFTVSGRLVTKITAATTSVSWDLKTSGGDNAASGIYLYVVTDGHGGHSRGKFVVIR